MRKIRACSPLTSGASVPWEKMKSSNTRPMPAPSVSESSPSLSFSSSAVAVAGNSERPNFRDGKRTLKNVDVEGETIRTTLARDLCIQCDNGEFPPAHHGD